MIKCLVFILCGNFNCDGMIYVYVVLYDWSKGGDNSLLNTSNNIYLYVVNEIEVKSWLVKSGIGC